jgi:hypothetical protein
MGESIMVWSKEAVGTGFRSAVLGVCLFLVITFVGLRSAAAATTHFIAANGSDSNNGTSKTTAWQHLPGMPSCTSNCNSYTPQPGDQFILRGGDTWTASSLGVNWFWSGTAGNPIYIGVDQTWFTGASWVRPVWSAAHPSGGVFFQTNAHDFTLDNIEMTGLLETGSSHPSFVHICGVNQIYDHLYLHGWSHDSTLNPSNGPQSYAFGGGDCANDSGTTVQHTVIDGADSSTGGMLVCFYGGVPNIAYSVCRNVWQAVEAGNDTIHDNLFENMQDCFMAAFGTGQCHENLLSNFGPDTASHELIYNNVLRNMTYTGAGGSFKLALGSLSCNNASSYAFNNILYNVAANNMIIPGGWQSCTNWGAWKVFNNTFECGTDSSTGDCAQINGANSGAQAIYNFYNNQMLTSGLPTNCTGVTVCNYNVPPNLTQTVATANGQGYTSGSTYAFSPTSGSGGTVGKGANEQSLCTTIAAFDAVAGAACQQDTTYGVGYNTSNHTVTGPARTALSRPSSSAWDMGAYQYNGQNQLPAPPTGLTAVVN